MIHIPRERTQQLKEEQAAKEAAEAEAANSEASSETATTSNESSNYNAVTSDIFGSSQYHGDGYSWSMPSYDGQVYHNGSFGRDMIINDSIITDSTYDYVNVADMGSIVDEYNKDYFTTGGKTISEAIEQLNNVHKGLVESGYFYGKHPEGEAPLAGEGGIIDLMQQFLQAKTSMDPTVVESATGAYNDDLEKAKNLKYKEYLKGRCDEYNQNPKILGLFLNYCQKHYSEQFNSDGSSSMVADGFNCIGQEYNDYGYFDSNGWNSRTPKYDNIPDTAQVGDEYLVNGGEGKVQVLDVYKDEITYDFLIQGFNGILDTIFHDVANLEKELDMRKEFVDYKKLDPRPEYSYYNG